MNKALMFILFIPLYFYALFGVFILKQDNIEKEALDTWRLNRVVNLCTDAATAEMLNTGDLGNNANKAVDPSVALDTFCEFFCDNFEITPTDVHKKNVLDKYLKAFVVTTYDGYYYLDNYNLTLKLPYSKQIASNPKDIKTYALRLDSDKVFMLQDTEDTSDSTKRRLTIYKTESPLTGTDKKSYLAGIITNALLESYYKNTNSPYNIEISFPFSTTKIQKTNAVNNPSVLAYISDFSTSHRNSVSAFSIGGSDIRQSDFIVGYHYNNNPSVKYYKYSSEYVKSADKTIEAVFSSAKDAAQKRYQYEIGG